MKKILLLCIALLITALISFGQINVDYWKNKGIEKFSGAEYKAAIEYFNMIIRFPPKIPAVLGEAYYLRGISKYNLSDFRGALIDLSHAIKHDTLNSEYYSIRGKTKDMLKDLSGALTDYNKALDLKPINTNAYINRGVHYIIGKEYDKAIADCDKIIQLKETLDIAYYFRALAKQYKSQFTEAMADFAVAIKLDPKNPEYYTRRAMNRYQMKDTIGAFVDLNKSIELDSIYSFAYFNRGLIYSEKADYRNALNDYNRVLQLDPENALTFYNRAGVKAELGRYAAAIEDYNKVLKINPSNFYTYFNRAIVWQRLGSFQKAITDYTTVVNLNPIFASAYYNRSQARRAIYDLKGAEEDYKTAIAINSNFERFMQSGLIDSSGLAKMAEFKADFGDIDIGSVANTEMSPIPNFIIQFKIDIAANENPTSSEFDIINTLNKGLFAEEFILTPKDVLNSQEKEKAFIAMLDTVEVSADNWIKLFERAILKFQLKNYSGSIEDYSAIIALNPQLAIVYFNRANTRYEMESYWNSLNDLDATNVTIGTTKLLGSPKSKAQKNYDPIIADYTACLKLYPGFYHAYFNRANIKILSNDYIGAIWDFSRAISYDPKFAEGYFNRGLTYIYIRKPDEGCLDLSKAGELGIDKAYDVIKKFCNKN
jgi:tetratricopeptide (TPR) repeat protein